MRNWWVEPAKAAKIAVWWDMKDCPIPEGYDASRVRPSLEGAFKERGYSGPVSITAYGDQTQTPGPILQGLFATGVSVAHVRPESRICVIHQDIVEWRERNPPPATIMIIANEVEQSPFAWDLARMQQRTRYNMFRAYSVNQHCSSFLLFTAKWSWEKLLGSGDNDNKIETTRLVEYPMLCCKSSCNFSCQSPGKFRKHLTSYKHARQESVFPMYTQVHRVTKYWGIDHAATPEYATADILVWWDMFGCPIPEGYDARWVRPSIEAAFQKLGYSGPVSITAFGDFHHTPDHLLRGLTSTGVGLAHTVYDLTPKRMFQDLIYSLEDNPIPTNILVICETVTYEAFSLGLVNLLQRQKHKLFLAYTHRPFEMSVLLTGAEWLWHSLLEGRGESTGMFHCKLCFYRHESPDFTSFDSFMKHLFSRKHAKEESKVLATLACNRRANKLFPLAEYDRNHRTPKVENSPKSKRKRKAFPTGFRLLDNYLDRLISRKCRTSTVGS